MNMMDRRSSARVNPEAHAPVRVDMRGADFIDVMYALDISRGGIGTQVAHSFDDCETDRIVDCLVQLPEPVNQSFRAQGRMRHIDGGRFGVEFKNLNENAQSLIDDYVDHRLQSASWWASIARRGNLSFQYSQYKH